MVDYMFLSAPEPPCFDEANLIPNFHLDIADLTYLVDYMFNEGPEPIICP